MSNAIVLATAPLDDYASRHLAAYGRIEVAPDQDEATLVRMVQGAVALVVRGAAPITARVIEAAGALRVIGRTGVGYDTIDIAVATARGIPVVYTPGAGARAVAEATLGFMLALTKRMARFDRELKAGNWKSRYEVTGGDLEGKTLGIVGLGRIGWLVAAMAKPFEMTVLACDPYLTPRDFAERGAAQVGLDELLQRSDFVSLHCPLTTETRGLIDRGRLAQMKRGAYLLNLARGGVIVSLDVIDESLRDGRLAGAALDVFDPAPPDPAHPVFGHENILTSPHAIATTEGALQRIFRSMTDDMVAVLEGRPPQFVVNPEVLAR